MIWFVYNLLFPFVFIMLLPRFLFRMARRGGYRRGFSQRFGFYSREVRRRLQGPRPVWVHAVSVGEMFVALRFIRAYRQVDPEAWFVVTTVTSTARAQAERGMDRRDLLLYFPLDFPWIVRRAIGAIRPRLMLLTECELWPNILRAAARAGVPCAVINARLSEKSYRGYRRIRPFFLGAIGCVTRVFAQSEADRARFVALGADAERIEVAGSAKYDVAEVDESGADKARGIVEAAGFGSDPILLAGSTWPGEEAILIDAAAKLRKGGFPALRLVLVPRHAERAPEVEALLQQRGVAYVRRSRLDARKPGDPVSDVLLVDTTGELKHLYGIATVVFVGKSLTARGGQNIIEPACFGKPVVVGPHMENFEAVADDFRRAGALLQVADAAGLVAAVRAWLADEAGARACGERAAEVVRAGRGVIEATARTAVRMALPSTGAPDGGQ